MFFKSLAGCVPVLFLIQLGSSQCKPNANNNSTSSNVAINAPSLISVVGQNVTISDSSSLLDSSGSDKSRNDREFPSSSRQMRNLDTTYHDSDDYDYNYGGVSPALGESELPDCILSRSEFYLSWWVNEDGTLRLPASNRPGTGFADLSLKFKTEDSIIKHVASMQTDNPNDVITFMSVANNALNRLPVDTLKMVNVSLQYLSLANNNFNQLFAYHNKTFQSWSAFPLMSNLKELDLRNCSLTWLDHDIFENLPNLEKLFLSHNAFSSISPKVFSVLGELKHLDLSYNKEELPFGYNIDPFSFYFSGLQLEEETFVHLKNLIFLDLSHSKLKQESVRALLGLQGKVEQLSLCFTEIPFIFPQMFEATNLKVLDLSGNPGLIPNLNLNYFEGLEFKLEILVFQGKCSNLKNLGPLRFLRKLRMLDLGNNNINQIMHSHFVNFIDLEILDLNTNHISNWYQRVFINNTRLKIVNLRKNNINLLTPEMLRDFNGIKFLAIGSNNFVCDCTLREFIERASYNARRYNCSSRRSKRSYTFDEFCDPKYHYDVFLREFHSYIRYVDESYKNIVGDQAEGRSFSRSQSIGDIETSNCAGSESSSLMTFDFLLLDYSENDYHCIESNGSSKKKVFFSEIASCQLAEQEATSEATTISNENEVENEEDTEFFEEQKAAYTLLFVYIGVGLPLTLIAALWLWKRKDIKYFFSILKNTLILSFDKADNKALLMNNRRRKSRSNNDNNDDYRFDLFVSYSEKDRGFVLDQLIPNLEKRSEITICLHERDFQVGLSILENIIQCMDQSRCLLLVVSESFLKSNWCSFEMHLAQHRLIETRREQLILILLQDIPKAKRPRTLSFLMRTKTYIMWPNEDKEELRNIFWKRLKKAIILNNWEPEKARIKPRHSIV